MSIKDDLIKYFSQLTDSSGGYGLNAKPQGKLGVDTDLTQPMQQTGNFGQLNPQVIPQGTGGFNQLNTMQNAMSNPIDAEKALSKVAEKPAYSDMQKQLIAKSVASMGGQKQQMQPDLKIINAQQAFAQMPDATQPQQIQEFKPEQMAMMLRRRNGGY
jgi:hypothetical protein